MRAAPKGGNDRQLASAHEQIAMSPLCPTTLSNHLADKLLRSPPYLEERTRAAQLLAFPLKL
jgi:hypothetical protein